MEHCDTVSPCQGGPASTAREDLAALTGEKRSTLAMSLDHFKVWLIQLSGFPHGVFSGPLSTLQGTEQQWWCIFHYRKYVSFLNLAWYIFIYIHIYSLQQVAFLVWTIYGEQGLFEGAAHKSLFNNFQDYSALFSPNFTILHFLALLNNFHHNSSLFSTIQYKFHYFALPGTLKQISALFSTIQYKFHYLEFPSTFKQL